ncbi:hypothetical protein MMC19_000613 [Ptychographa xylographoides]|nr:hypothetical protein [Ptychographa xylographoides]
MVSFEPLPRTHRALVLSSTEVPPKVQTIATPQAGPGSAVVRILVANVVAYAHDIYNGKRQYPYPTPLVIGSSAIGCIAAVGPDATLLTPGQLVFIDCTIRGRDDLTAIFLSGIHEGFTEGSRKLMHGEWRDTTYAEYAKMPLENCYVLDEKRLLGSVGDGGLGYRVEDLAYISAMLVPFGGLRDINLNVGETVIVAPATGSFGGAAVFVALAMGAKVIAMGRNAEALAKVAALSERVGTVQITGDVQAEVKALQKFGRIDAFFDISPPEAAKSTHIKSCILSLRHGGRVSLMGGPRVDVPFPYAAITHRNLQLKGKWMYEREDIAALIKMIEIGVLQVGANAGIKVVGKFPLEKWDEAFTAAEQHNRMGTYALIAP